MAAAEPPAGTGSSASEQLSTAYASSEAETAAAVVGTASAAAIGAASNARARASADMERAAPATAPEVPHPVSSPSPAMQLSSSLGRRPRVLLAASGSVAAIKFPILAQSVSEWAEVRALSTSSALHFVEPTTLPRDVPLYTDEDEWRKWSKLGDTVLHIELRKWADVMVIAPLSANTLAKLAGGICDNLLTCVVRAWDFGKPLLVAPAMNTHMWTSPFTTKHLAVLQELGVILASPISKTLACGDVGTGAMAEPAVIEAAIRKAVNGMDLRGGSASRLLSP